MRARILAALAATATITVALLPPHPTKAGNPFRRRPKSSVECLAEQIDKLECHIEEYGSVVAKKPDVWGEARLTRHRREFEEQLKAQLTEFKSTINASISRSDQAFLVNSLAVSAALGGAEVEENEGVVFSQDILDNPNFDREAPRRGQALGFAATSETEKGIALEPVIGLDQLKRYLNHLHEIRRVNEGDDIGDAPGYTINLVRIPVSVLPGKQTRQCYGAELTVTATPYLSEDTLPTVFRQWVINDLVDELTIPVAGLAALKPWESLEERKRLCGQLPELYAARARQNVTLVVARNERKKLKDKGTFSLAELDVALGEAKLAVKSASLFDTDKDKDTLPTSRLEDFITQQSKQVDETQAQQDAIQAQIDEIESRIEKASAKLFQQGRSTSRRRRARYSVPNSIRERVYARAFGYEQVLDCKTGKKSLEFREFNRFFPVAQAMSAFLEDAESGNQIPDARDFLREELKAAHDFLSPRNPLSQQLWSQADGLAEMIRGGQDVLLEQRQKEFGRIVGSALEGVRSARREPHDFRVVEELAWCILVESALLNDAVVEDMRRIARKKNCPCVVAGHFMKLYLPAEVLPPDTTMAFNEYVKCRWPIKVFAVDPVTQDQNVADTFSLRRELQLAASIALASGQLSLDNFTQFARRIELDTETIALNRTTVGFSHGNDTFGWRFYPRFQSPELDGNLKTFGQTLFGGPSRDSLIKDRRLEPGERDCVAIVVTPGFVPYVTFDTRSNWFQLTNPQRKKFDLQQSVRLGRDVVALKRAKELCIRDEHLHRRGEVYRLTRAVQQLEKRLPLQTAYVEMPTEDSKGGFQAIADGTTSLGPELIGFYGEPGIDKGRDKTSIFLLGDNFSVHDTQVIVGGTALRDLKKGDEESEIYLISRQIMKITVSNDDVTTMKNKDGDEVVDIHVATPYGVSSHIHVPVVNSPAATAAAAAATALASHEAKYHTAKYSWTTATGGEPPELVATIFEDAVNVDRLELAKVPSDNPSFTLSTSVVHPDVEKFGETETGELAFFVDFASNDAETEAVSVAIGTFPISVGQTFWLPHLLNKLKPVIGAKIPKGFDAKELTLRGYIRFDKDDQPVLRIENDLKIRIQRTIDESVVRVAMDGSADSDEATGEEEATDDPSTNDAPTEDGSADMDEPDAAELPPPVEAPKRQSLSLPPVPR